MAVPAGELAAFALTPTFLGELRIRVAQRMREGSCTGIIS
jgi:hypothetical protein